VPEVVGAGRRVRHGGQRSGPYWHSSVPKFCGLA